MTNFITDLDLKFKEAEEKGNLENAIKYVKDIVIRILQDGGEIADAVFYAKKLAELYIKIGDIENGKQAFQAVLNLSIAVYGENNLFTIEVYHVLARLNMELENYEIAMVFASKAFLQLQSFDDISNALFIDTVNRISVIFEKLEKFEILDEFLQYKYKIFANVYGKDAIETVDVARDRINNDIDLGKFDKALKSAIKLESVIKKLFGLDSAMYVGILDSLACIYESCGDYESAVKYYEKISKLDSAKEDEEYKLVYLEGLVSCYLELDELKKAVNALESLIETYVVQDKLEDAAEDIESLDDLYQELGIDKTAAALVAKLKKSNN